MRAGPDVSVGSGPIFGRTDGTVVTLQDSTISNNLATGGDGGKGGSGGNGLGGGVSVGAGSTLGDSGSTTGNTITGNHANGGKGKGGGSDGEN